MNEKKIYTTNSGGEILATNSTEVEVMLDSIGFKRKPSKHESRGISKRLESSGKSITIGELAEKVGRNGFSMVPALLDGQGRKKENWVKQQLFPLDFYKGITLEEFDQRCEEIGIQPAFVYLTFSHTDMCHKFRAVFVLDHVVNDERMRNLLVRALMKLFPQCDRICLDGTRFFYGGNSIHRIDVDRRVDLTRILDRHMNES